MKQFKRHISGPEKTTAIAFWILLLLAIITQVVFGENILSLIAIFAVLAVIFSLLVFLPEVYEFGEKGLLVSNPKLKHAVEIPYVQIIKIDTVGSFRHLKKDFDSTEVILTFKTARERKRTMSCHPKDVLGFVKILQKNCPHLVEGDD